jgi:cell wall-associated NlpC family hydrolase
MESMRVAANLTLATALCGFTLGVWAQGPSRNHGATPVVTQEAGDDQRQDRDLQLNDDDRLSLIAAALDARVRRDSEHDCSHLVHAIYEQAGFPYTYAPSADLYAGVEGFQRVKQPEPGDLIVWRGHAGIVVQPSKHIFFSFMTSGPGTDDYQSPYWKGRGRPRFYRYIKNESCAECDSPRRHSRQLVKIKR